MYIPNNWSEVSLEVYLELLELDVKDLTQFEMYLEKLCILSDSDHWEDEEFTAIYTTISNNNWINNIPTTFNNIVDDFTVKPFSKLTLAEWIDLDSFISTNNISNIIALLYRKTSVDDWGLITYEPYQYDINDRAEYFLGSIVTDVIGIVDKVKEYRIKVLTNFSSLFSSMEDEDFEESEEDKKYLTPIEIEEQKAQIKKDNEKKKYSWEYLLNNVSNGDWSRVEAILDLPATFVFNMMMMQKKFETN